MYEVDSLSHAAGGRSRNASWPARRFNRSSHRHAPAAPRDRGPILRSELVLRHFGNQHKALINLTKSYTIGLCAGSTCRFAFSSEALRESGILRSVRKIILDPAATTAEPERRHVSRSHVFWRTVLTVLILGAVLYFVVGWVVRSEATGRVAGARQLIATGQPEAARSSLSWLLHFEPDHDEALLVTALSFQNEGATAKAAEVFASVREDSEWHETASVERCKVLMQDEHVQAAEDALNAHLVRYPESAEANDALLFMYHNQFRNREIERRLQQRLEQQPGQIALLRLALMNEFRPRVAHEWVASLEGIESRRPGQLAVLRGLGYCYWRLSQMRKAQRYIDAALSFDADNIETRIIAAGFLIEQNQLAAAEKFLTDSPDAAKSRDNEPAVKLIGSSKAFVDDDRVWWLLSDIAERRDQHDRAMMCLQRALKQRPHELQYVHRHGSLLRRAGQNAESATRLQLALKLENYRTRLLQIVWSSEFQQPSARLCREVAELCRKRGRTLQFRGWQMVAQQIASVDSTR